MMDEYEIDIQSLDDLEVRPSDALIVIDLQNDFLPGGSLAVPDGDAVITGINQLAEIFYQNQYRVIYTQDWHPKDHASFASNHDGKEPYDKYNGKESAIGPVLWPDHCVAGTEGAKLTDGLNKKFSHLIIRKGFNPKLDSYSAFLENDKKTKTGLEGYLKSAGITRIILTGLALDYCVYYSALDGRAAGLDVVLALDLSRGINSPEGRVEKSLKTMKDKGVKFIASDNIKIPK